VTNHVNPAVCFKGKRAVNISNKITIVIGAIALTACAGSGTTSRPNGYVIDSRNAVVKDPFNLCWRTGYWTPALSIAECDPSLAPKPGSPAAAPRPATPVPLTPATPAPAVAAPAVPAPVPVVKPAPAAAAPIPAAPKRCDGAVTLEADQLFAFNSGTLSNSARSRLDSDVMSRLATCATVDVVIVTGHTDRIGSQQYNQRLSEQRAATVKSYLTGKGLAADKVETMGMGKTAPAKFCPDSRNQRDLIACLAPNRRVTVEIKGLAK
jgi:OmpA-OmpF porin, OOP family